MSTEIKLIPESFSSYLTFKETITGLLLQKLKELKDKDKENKVYKQQRYGRINSKIGSYSDEYLREKYNLLYNKIVVVRDMCPLYFISKEVIDGMIWIIPMQIRFNLIEFKNSSIFLKCLSNINDRKIISYELKLDGIPNFRKIIPLYTHNLFYNRYTLPKIFDLYKIGALKPLEKIYLFRFDLKLFESINLEINPRSFGIEDELSFNLSLKEPVYIEDIYSVLPERL